MKVSIKTTTTAGTLTVVKSVSLETFGGDKPITIGIAMEDRHKEPIIEIHQHEDSPPIFGGGFSNN